MFLADGHGGTLPKKAKEGNAVEEVIAEAEWANLDGGYGKWHGMWKCDTPRRIRAGPPLRLIDGEHTGKRHARERAHGYPGVSVQPLQREHISLLKQATEIDWVKSRRKEFGRIELVNGGDARHPGIQEFARFRPQ